MGDEGIEDLLPLLDRDGKYRRAGVERDDLKQEGALGLLRAAEKHRREKGCLRHYASVWLMGKRKRLVGKARRERERAGPPLDAVPEPCAPIGGLSPGQTEAMHTALRQAAEELQMDALQPAPGSGPALPALVHLASRAFATRIRAKLDARRLAAATWLDLSATLSAQALSRPYSPPPYTLGESLTFRLVELSVLWRGLAMVPRQRGALAGLAGCFYLPFVAALQPALDPGGRACPVPRSLPILTTLIERFPEELGLAPLSAQMLDLAGLDVGPLAHHVLLDPDPVGHWRQWSDLLRDPLRRATYRKVLDRLKDIQAPAWLRWGGITAAEVVHIALARAPHADSAALRQATLRIIGRVETLLFLCGRR